MGQGPRIGYIGIDAMSGTAASGEAMGLLKAGVPLELISLDRIETPITGKDERPFWAWGRGVSRGFG
ncbi:hypothetical protein ACYOEI_32735, partial [Singulisphaera rosea]